MSETGERAPDRVVAGRYRLERMLGRGGMGVVWLAVDTLIERRVALKELRAPVSAAAGDRSSFVERALREARNAGRLNHPGVVGVHDVIAPTGDDVAVYIVMEYVQAPTLTDVLDEQGPLPARQVALLGLGILDAITAAHTMGIVHRDIKPSNILVDGDTVKLTDFGIALAAEDTRLTRSGVIGTQAYLAPECFDTGQAGPAADLWALGATLFHAVAGRAPFERETATATLRAILFEDVPAPPCEPPLSEVIAGLLTRPVDQRLSSDAARDMLQQAATQPVKAPPTTNAPSAGDQATWETQATTVHRPPPTTPTPQPWASPAQPATPSPGPPPRRRHTPWIIGGAAAVVGVLMLALVVAASGRDDGDSDAPSDDTAEENPEENPAAAQAFAQDFLDAINSGDEDTAVGMLCSNSDDEAANIGSAVAGNATLEIRRGADADTSAGGFFGRILDGTVNGESVVGEVAVHTEDDGTWCIFTFYTQ